MKYKHVFQVNASLGLSLVLFLARAWNSLMIFVFMPGCAPGYQK